MKINLLTADVYNRIAAGEVVDRPYSVVKELVENAIDAGASEITVEVDGGGKRLVRVTDNGSGISRDDLKNAFSPHATSKLKSAEDLFNIHTLGFRGEAIASIAAVSRMKIVSKTADDGAYSLASEGGVLGEILEAGGANGTEVTVENLFYNTPARLKFLKSDSQEEGDVANMISRFILSRPEIAFTYLSNGKVKYRSFGDGLKSALATVYGADVLKQCYEISADKHGILLSGFIGNQQFSKPNRSYQSLFVNGRYVVNQTVSAAVTNAYAAYLMKRQYPFYVLFLNVPAEIVDVNVHPNKADVRFADNQIIYGSVYSVISSVLDGNSRALEYLAEAPVSVKAEQKQTPTKQERTEIPVPPAPAPKQMTYEEAKKELAFDVSPVGGKGSAPRFTPPAPPLTLEVRAPIERKEEDVFEENRRLLRESEQKAMQDKIKVDTLEYKGELFRTYLFYEADDCAYIIDQHAAHERLIYDRLRAKCESRSVVSQPMLVPFLITVNSQEFAFLEKNFSLLRELGFEIDDFGGTSVKVSAVPVDLQGMDLDAFFQEVLAGLENLRAIK
ncbi:MAG: DNA mismatch repair endonuclease MutL, partial [Clostridiales bacterium]|nr:DNA mismatch repair endonuclease MutL [Clostridiales bacterium]